MRVNDDYEIFPPPKWRDLLLTLALIGLILFSLFC